MEECAAGDVHAEDESTTCVDEAPKCSASSLPEQSRDDTHSAGLARLLDCLIEDCHTFEESTDGVRRLDKPPRGALPRGERRIFTLVQRRTLPRSAASKGGEQESWKRGYSNGYDYEQKYPVEEEGKAMDPNARLWSMYLDEADHFDLDMVVSIRDSVDVILVFAGLFSAIVSTLVSQASTTLKPDYGQIISSLLMELIEVQRATGAGTIKDIARSPLGSESHFTPSSSDRWVNGTWFASLALSLVTALLSTLVKQWIHAYMSPTFNGSSQAQGRARHFRYMGFEKWHVPLIAGLLPTLLHLSLFIFFAGLVVLLFNLDHLIGAVVASIAILAYAAYTVTNLLPLWYSQCPYKTPLSDYAFKVLRIWIPYQYGKIQQLWNLFTIRTPFRGDAVHNISLSDDREKLAQPEQLQSLRHTESRAVHFQADELDAQMIGWLCETSVNPSVKAVVITSLRDLPFGFSAVETLRDCVLPYICAGLRECTKKGLLPLSITSSDTRRVIPGFEAKADVYYQAHLQLTVPGYSRRTHSRLKVLCGCDWVAGESEVAHHHLNVQSIPGTTYRTIEDLSLPALVHYPTCHVSELALLLPTKTSNRMWITLLHRAVVMVLPWRATSYFSLEDDWEHFVSLWRSMPKNDTIERIRDQAEICTFLQRTLLSAYLCHTIRPAGSTPVQDPELLYVAMNEESTLRRASSDEYLSLRSYYSHHTLVQIIYHLTQAAATHAATPLLYVIDRLVQLEGYDLRSPRENTTKFAYSTVLPIDHSLLPLLRHLFPTPPAIRNIIAHHDGDIDRVRLFWDMTFALWHLLLRNVQDERLYDVVTNHDFLGGLDVLHEYLLCGRRHQLEDDLRVKTEVTFQNLVEDYVNGVSSLSNKKYHLASIISYFDRMCCWAYKKDSSRLFPETVYIGLDAWFGTVVAITAEELSTRLAVDDGEDVDEIVDRVAQTLYRENPGDRCSVDTFLEKLRSELNDAIMTALMATLRAGSAGAPSTPQLHSHSSVYVDSERLHSDPESSKYHYHPPLALVPSYVHGKGRHSPGVARWKDWKVFRDSAQSESSLDGAHAVLSDYSRGALRWQ